MSNLISLGAHFESFVADQVESGRYSDASDVVRTGLQLLEEQEKRRQEKVDELRRLIEEGIASGDAGPLDIRALYAEVAAEVARR